jgi:PPOX class probable F420-dependent enzyme
MSPLTRAVGGFLDEHLVGALATRSAAGRVHLSPVYYVRDGERLLISTEAGRRKARDVQETEWASLCVTGAERPFPSVTVAGAATIRRENIGAATAAIAQRMLALDELPEVQSDEALAGVGRVLLALQIERVGPASHLDIE